MHNICKITKKYSWTLICYHSKMSSYLNLGKGRVQKKKNKINYGKFHIGSRPPLPPPVMEIFINFFF